ncbi:branched-chain amino acid ABC transporter permease [Betaproteobacteria bacterium LSUCC0117]|jgi:branched-chain amino acid transport system permease protein|nr:branched-chain amino acid ABC transporter permease [Betaproteobacteria bacterium LSUCC0117]
MFFSFELLFEAVLFGLLLGCFYAAVSLGLSVAFGLLDVPHVAHPALLIVGSYGAYMLGGWGIDPLVSGFLLMPVFFLVGMLLYRFYYETFESRGSAAGVNGLAFFFGIAFIIEVLLVVAFGVDQRSAEADYIGESLRLGDLRLPYRLLVAAGVALVLTVVLTQFFSKTFVGRAIKAVGQDEGALRLMGADPVRIKQLAFGIATSVNALAGAMLIIVSPVEPTMDRIYIGRTFCVVVLAGMGSMSGTLVAGLVLGITESIVLTLFGASWATAVAFGLLLLMLGLRPQGLFGR